MLQSTIAGITPYIGLRKQTSVADFSGSRLAEVVVADSEGRDDVRLAASCLSTGGDATLYRVERYEYGTLESPVFDAAHPFDTAIVSWNAQTPPGTWLQIELRAYRPVTSSPTIRQARRMRRRASSMIEPGSSACG